LALIKATGLTPSALPSANASLPMSAAPSKSPLDRTSDLILDGQREIMIQTAQRAVRQNNHNDAVKAWQRAIDLTAPDSADRQRLLISLSKSYESLKQPAQAARFLIDGANQTPTTANAAAMHLRGCWNLARSTTTDSSSNQSTSKLIDALKQHLQRWPRSETVDQATLWLVAEYQQRQQFDEALQTMVGAGTMSQSIVRQFRNTFFLAKKEWHDAPRRIQNLAQKIVSHFDQQWTAIEDSSVAQDLTATAAEIGLASECLTLNEISEWIVRHSSRFTINRKSEIQLYRALLIALLDEDLLRCEQIFLNMAPSEAQCRSILALAKQQPVNHPDLQMASDQFGFLVTQQALKQPLSVQQTTAWRFEQAKFLAATGQTERSLSLLTPLAQQFKSDRSIQIQYARALSKIPDRGADALTAWRLLAQRLPPKSENWYEAKFNVAQGLAKKKQPDAAKQVLKYVQALYGWRGSEWAKPIEQLLRSL
jgi:TolA-binding protein